MASFGVVYIVDKNVSLEMYKAGWIEVYRGTQVPGIYNGIYWDAEKIV